MAKDLDGKLWLGTYMEGLTGFDGKRFKHYRDIPGSKDGLSNNSVYSLYVDAKNRLWIGTLEGGLDCLDQSTGKLDVLSHGGIRRMRLLGYRI